MAHKTHKTIYDGTAPDAVDELAGVLSAEITPRGVQWIKIIGKNMEAEDFLQEEALQITKTVMEKISKSNFHVEMYQCIIDLIVAGTAVLLIEPIPFPVKTPLRFTALPLDSVILDDSKSCGYIDTLFRTVDYKKADLIEKFPTAKTCIEKTSCQTYTVLESIEPVQGKYIYSAILKEGLKCLGLLKTAVYNTSPFVAFRWQRTAGEVYGHSPIMKALPDIKTANKVVELTLKNAAISVTGIWQADDDGILNPANIRLVPGAIIPKAVGSSGLQPLKSPGDFNMSNLVLESLQNRIRHAMFTDVFTTTIARSATEIQERALRSRQVLNAVYERVVQECLYPIAHRVYNILQNTGFVPDLSESMLKLDVLSPIERGRSAQKLLQTKEMLQVASAFGSTVSTAMNMPKLLRWIVKEMELPDDILIQNSEQDSIKPGLTQ